MTPSECQKAVLLRSSIVGILWKTAWCSIQRRIERPRRVGSLNDQHLKRRMRADDPRSPTTTSRVYWRRGYLNYARHEHCEMAWVRFLLNSSPSFLSW